LAGDEGAFGALNLARSEEACFWDSGTGVVEMEETDYLRLKLFADRVEEIGNWGVVRGFGDTSTEASDGADLFEVLGQNGHRSVSMMTRRVRRIAVRIL
jgi:hypothetical protein